MASCPRSRRVRDSPSPRAGRGPARSGVLVTYLTTTAPHAPGESATRRHDAPVADRLGAVSWLPTSQPLPHTPQASPRLAATTRRSRTGSERCLCYLSHNHCPTRPRRVRGSPPRRAGRGPARSGVFVTYLTTTAPHAPGESATRRHDTPVADRLGAVSLLPIPQPLLHTPQASPRLAATTRRSRTGSERCLCYLSHNHCPTRPRRSRDSPLRRAGRGPARSGVFVSYFTTRFTSRPGT